MKRYVTILFAVLALASCDKGGYDAETASEIVFNIGFPETKATSTAFESGDEISLYAVEYSGETRMPLQIGGNYFNNEKLSYDGSVWTGTRPLYWSDKACDFYAFYPCRPSIGSMEAYPFSIETDQNGDGYEASDLMYACALNVSRSDGSVNLNFSHIMSKVVVRLVKGASFEGEIPDDVVAHIYSTATACNVNWAKGSVEKDPFGGNNTITMKKISNTQFEAVVIPQNLEKKTPLVEISMGGIAYLLEYSLSFRPGYVHTITVTLNTSPEQEQIEISIDPNVNPWN